MAMERERERDGKVVDREESDAERMCMCVQQMMCVCMRVRCELLDGHAREHFVCCLCVLRLYVCDRFLYKQLCFYLLLLLEL